MKQILRYIVTFGLIVICRCDKVQLNGFCSYEFDTINCVYNVECSEQYEFPFYTYRPYNELCSVEKTPGVLYQETEYPQVNLRFNHENAIFSLKGTYGAHIISTLDLSFNYLTDVPTIPYMENLQKLNLSGNVLTTAILSNQYELISLFELDLSHNAINSFEINTYHSNYRNLRNLNLANNYIETIPETTFYSLLQLEYLNLSYNLISTLSILTFEGLKNILCLNLSHNMINELNLSLVRFSKLKELDLSNNQISHIKQNDFKHLVNLMKLDVSSNALLDIEDNLFDSMIALQTIDLRNNVLTDIEKVGFSNLTNLVSVYLSSNHLIKLPAGLFKASNLSEFSIRENNLQGPIAKYTFTGMSLVKIIDLSYQKLTSIEDYTFQGLDNVEEILLNNNNINAISENSFKGVPHLKTLDLSRNQLTYFDVNTEDLKNLTSLLLQYNFITQAKKDIFNNLNGLQILDLSFNNISIMEKACFQSLNNLISLHINNNNLNFTILNENVFAGLISLPSLDISGVKVNLVQNGSFKGMMNLEEVLITHSDVSEIQFNAFYNAENIKILNLTYNKLTSFNINTTDLTNLSILLLGNNLLKFIEPNMFKGLTRLTTIELTHNNIENLDENIFSDQMDISYLDLSNNALLKSLPSIDKCKNLDISGIRLNYALISKNITIEHLLMANSSITNLTALNLKYFISLDVLVVSHNEIVNVEVGSFNGLTKLSQLDLSYNKISIIEPGVFAENANIKILNISHNSLITINYGIWRGLNNINIIDVSYNNILDLESEKFYELKSLSYLIADYNKIKYFNATEFTDSNLAKLSIGNNPIPCQILSKLRKENIPFRITALQLHALGFENVNGIACNSGNDNYIIKENTENSEILSEIRDILRNITTNNAFKSINMSGVFDKSYMLQDTVVKTILKEERNKSVDMLDKILKTLMLVNISRSTPIKPNIDEHKLYAELYSSFRDMKQYIKEVNDKFSFFLSNKESPNVANALSANESATSTKSSFFLEVCVGSILALLIGCILFKLYSSIFKNKIRDFLPRRFSEEIENSDL